MSMLPFECFCRETQLIFFLPPVLFYFLFYFFYFFFIFLFFYFFIFIFIFIFLFLFFFNFLFLFLFLFFFIFFITVIQVTCRSDSGKATWERMGKVGDTKGLQGEGEGGVNGISEI